MIHFHQSRLLPYSHKDLYDLISDVEAYPDFIPWCKKCLIIEQKTPTDLLCQMDVGFGPVVTRYYSKVFLEPFERVTVIGQGDVFNHLSTLWTLESLGNTLTKVDIRLAFKFNQIPFQALAEKVFPYASLKIIEAFDQQAFKKMTKGQKK